MIDQPLLLTILFLAATTGAGHIGEKLIDILGKPIWQWLPKAKEAKTELASFTKAYETSRRLLLEDLTIQFQDRMRLYEAFGMVMGEFRGLDERQQENNRKKLEALATKLEGAAFLEDRPDIPVIADLLDFIIRYQSLPSIPRRELERGTSIFISTFQTQLFLQPSFEDLLLKRRQWQSIKGPLFDTKANYLAQVVKLNQTLDFVGIPELKDRNTIQLQNIFINLRAEASGYWHYRGLPNDRSESLSVNDAMRGSKRLVILGDPGAGKTTLLKFVTLIFAQNQAGRYLRLGEQRLPIFVRISDYVAKRAQRSTDYSILDYLNTIAHENLLLNLEPDFFEWHLSRGECCVCFDGLDELGSIGLKREIVSIVDSFVARYKENRVIITSRLVGYIEAPLNSQEFSHYRVLPFNDEDIQEFVKKWYLTRVADAKEAQELSHNLVQTIFRESRIKALATNPLLLTIIALVHRIEAQLPHERVKLYEKCVVALVETWEKVKRLDPADAERPSYKYRRRLLEQIAFWLHSQPGDVGDVRTVKAGSLKLQVSTFLRSYPRLQLDEELAWQEAELFIELTKSRTGILIERGLEHGEQVFAFAHLTFQEYLAASDIRKRLIYQGSDSIWGFLQDHLHSSRWREVILLLLSSLNEYDELPTIIVRRILSAGEVDDTEPVLHRHLFFAAQALADRVDVSIALHDKIVDSLINIVELDQVGIYDALQYLQLFYGDEYVVGNLARLIQDTNLDEWIRMQAALSVGEIALPTSPVSLELIRIASDVNESSDIRYNAAYALGRMGKVTEAVRLLEDLEEVDLSRLKYYLNATNVQRLPPQSLNTIEEVTYISLDKLIEDIRDHTLIYHYEPDSSDLPYLAYLQERHESDRLYPYPPTALIDILKDIDVPLQTRLTATRFLIHSLNQDDKSYNDYLVQLLELAGDTSIDRQLRQEIAVSLQAIMELDD